MRPRTPSLGGMRGDDAQSGSSGGDWKDWRCDAIPALHNCGTSGRASRDGAIGKNDAGAAGIGNSVCVASSCRWCCAVEASAFAET